LPNEKASTAETPERVKNDTVVNSI
jgi:hypothetical protein